MTPLKQPRGSSLCGQTCVAMACRITLEDACGLVGHRHGTRTKELARVLRGRGFRCKDTLTRSRADQMPDYALVKMSFRGRRNWHWVLLWDGALYDPDPAPQLGTLTSFLDLT